MVAESAREGEELGTYIGRILDKEDGLDRGQIFRIKFSMLIQVYSHIRNYHKLQIWCTEIWIVELGGTKCLRFTGKLTSVGKWRMLQLGIVQRAIPNEVRRVFTCRRGCFYKVVVLEWSVYHTL